MYNRFKGLDFFKNKAKFVFLVVACACLFAVICPKNVYAQSVDQSTDPKWEFWSEEAEQPFDEVPIVDAQEERILEEEPSPIVEAVKTAAKTWWSIIKSIGKAVVTVAKTVAQFAGVQWHKECPTAQELVDKYQTCKVCDIFSSMFYGISYVAQEVYDTVSSSANKLLVVFASLWLALEVLKVVASIAPVDGGEFFKKIGLIFFKVAIVSFALMGGPAFVFENIIGPVMQGGASFGLIVLGEDPSYCDNIDSLSSGALPAGVHQSFRCLFEAIYDLIYRGFVYGHALCCYATSGGYAGELVSLGSTFGAGSLRLFGGRLSLSFGPSMVVPDFSLLISGIVFYVFAFLVVLVLPFYLVDSILKLGIAVFMMPMLMVAWVFPLTSWFAKKGFDMILNCVLMFIMTAMVVSLNMTIINAAISNQDFNYDDLYELISQAKDKHAIEQIKTLFEFSGLNMIVFIAAHIWAFMMFGKIDQFAGHFAQTVGSGFSNRLGGIAFKTAKKVALVAVAGAKKMSQPAENPGKQMVDNAKKTAQAAKNVANSAQSQMKETGRAAKTSFKAMGKAGAEIGKAGAQAGAETGKNASSSAKTAASGAKFFGVGLLVTVPLAAAQFTAQQSVTTAKFAAKSAAAMAKAAAKIAVASARLATKTVQNTAKITSNSAKTVRGAVRTAKEAPHAALRSKPWKNRKDKKA